MKTCSRCREAKPHQEFGKDRITPDGYKAYCRACAAAYLREHRQQQPERHRQYELTKHERHGDKILERDRKRWAAKRSKQDRESRRRFATKVRARYGISLDEYDALVAQPCQICGATADMVLDHCHKTAVIRGPLCRWCNLGLGYFKDNPARLRAAADYLESHA